MEQASAQLVSKPSAAGYQSVHTADPDIQYQVIILCNVSLIIVKIPIVSGLAGYGKGSLCISVA